MKDDIDYLIEALEEMIDARDEMWEEEKHCNYRAEMRIREERYDPAREKLKFFLKEIVRLKSQDRS
jgi:hypothetical protein